jgi:epimerase EvaD
MKARRLAVEGATEFTPELFPDERGIFVSPFQGPAFSEASWGPVYPVAQVSISVSKQGVVRGLHLTLTPPGMARYVHCPRGSALDIVADLRLGSPTFGQTDSVILDQEAFRAVYLPVGVGHAFVALEDDTVVSYLLSKSYVPAHELTVSVFDPSLGLPIPAGIEPIMSAKDRDAPTLAHLRASGLLPQYSVCREIERTLLGSP